MFSANEKHTNLGRLKCDDIKGAVFVNSPIDQNRALHNCIVGFVVTSGDVSSKKIFSKDSTNALNLSWEAETEAVVEERSNEFIASEEKLVGRIVYIFENPVSRMIGYLQLETSVEANDTNAVGLKQKEKKAKKKGEKKSL